MPAMLYRSMALGASYLSPHSRSHSPVRRITIHPALAAPLLAAAGCGRDTPSAQATPLGDSPPALEPLATPAPAGSAEPNLTVADGRAYLSWLEPTPASGHALRFATLENGQWSAPRTVAQGSRFFVNWADFPSLHALPGGRLAAHWLERSGGGRNRLLRGPSIGSAAAATAAAVSSKSFRGRHSIPKQLFGKSANLQGLSWLHAQHAPHELVDVGPDIGGLPPVHGPT